MLNLKSYKTSVQTNYSPEEIKQRLGLYLPGHEAQWRMAPAGRPSKVDQQARKAAVLVPLVLQENSSELVLIQRTTYAGVHSAQFAFPGGKFDEGEEFPSQVALREVEEEIGVRAHNCTILGELSSLYIPVSGMHVFPIVAALYAGVDFVRNEREVHAIHRVPLAHFFAPENSGIYNIKPLNRTVPGFRLETGIVWGATAMMLSELLAVLEPDLWSELSKRNLNNN